MSLRQIYPIALCCVAPIGCGTMDPSTNAVTGENSEYEEVDTSGQPVSSGEEFHWEQGNVSTAMGAAPNRACFLTRVTGKFQGGGEAVYSYVSGGSWYLGGRSLAQGISARARCVSMPASAEYSWGQRQQPVYMGTAAGRTCFLTRVTGHFEGGGEWVHVYVSGGSWYLGGGSEQDGVGASARCVDLPSYQEYSWSQGRFQENMGNASNRACFLTRMTGKFKGGGEFIQVFNNQGIWFLGGDSKQEGVGASARCI
ncbi:hypothetical protein [Sorangium sp. So ce861]|uniref:hypothetical protein n=1 Tax=Sorangium sp. So ce861 TaxID=3133323 RepID=UPI003F5D81B9